MPKIPAPVDWSSSSDCSPRPIAESAVYRRSWPTEFCRDRGWSYCVIGGLAAAHWGRPRVTQDVDLSQLTGISHEDHFVDTLLSPDRARRSDARTFALGASVLLLEAANGVYVEIGLAGLPFEERMVRCAVCCLLAKRRVGYCIA